MVERDERRAVRRLGPPDVDDVVGVLSEAFHDYPVMRFVLGDEGDYDSRLLRLVAFFVMVRVVRGQVLLGVGRAGDLAAAALVSYPRRQPSPPGLAELRDETWARLGRKARSRYEAFGAATAPFALAADHVYLGMIGVRRSSQGTGLGRDLLEAVHALSDSDEESRGVALSTEVESNVSLYQHFGYEILGSTSVASAFTTWIMWRPRAL